MISLRKILFIITSISLFILTGTIIHVKADSTLPAPWQEGDIGTVTPSPGSASYDGASQTFSVIGGGFDIWDTHDDFHYVYQSLTGDGTISARVTSQTNTNASAKAGVMIKQSPTVFAPYAMTAITPSKGYTFQWDFQKHSASAPANPFPNAWVRISRVGDTFSSYVSADGVTWTQVGTSKTVSMSSTVTVGLFVTSHASGSLSTVTFDHVTITTPSTTPTPSPSPTPTADNWPQFLHDLSLSANSSDTGISQSSASSLAKLWSYKTAGVIAASPSIVDGKVFVGSWDGYEYALDAKTGTIIWKTYLGKTTANCNPPNPGVSSAAAIKDGVVYVGGGDNYWYALDENSGAVLWKVFTGDTSADVGYYNWSSPILHNGYAYIGIASLGDCPLVPGQLLKVNLATHAIEGTLNLVPSGEIGGGIWTTPAYDTETDTIYVTTGTENKTTQQYAQAMLAINANTMTITDYWKLPESEAVVDSDFGTSPILFTDANNRKLVAAVNKNGKLYAYLRNNLSAGTVWEQQVAEGGDCPTCGQSSVSSGTFMNGTLFFAGNQTIINGHGYQGSVRAFDPTTGAIKWEHPTQGSVIAAISSANGVIYVGAGNIFEALDANTGHTLYSYDLGSDTYAAPSIANGVVYIGNLFGSVFAFSLPTTQPPTPPADPSCPTGYTCQDIPVVSPSGNELVSNGTWTVTAGGTGYAGTSDAFRLISQTASGDAQVVAQVTSQDPTLPNAQAGVMIRQNNDAGSPFYALWHTPSGYQVAYRSAFGKPVTVLNTINASYPLYLSIQRIGDIFQAAVSSDGTTYTLVPGTTKMIVMPYTIQAGIAQSSTGGSTVGNATYTDVSVGGLSLTFNPKSSASPCPNDWSCQDVGNPSTSGDQSLTNNTWTVNGAGGDIWGTYDEFHYVWKTAPSDATIKAKITSQTNTDANAKAGIMLRTDASRDSAYYAMFLTPSNTVVIHYRFASGYQSEMLGSLSGTAPAYMQLTRSGNTITAWTSSDGSNWIPVAGSTVTLNSFQGNILAGLAVTSHDTTQVSTAKFEDASVTNTAPPPPTICPASWSCNDIGYPLPEGEQILRNGVWTMQAGGGDIWESYDQFRLISQDTSASGEFVAHITSQTNSSEWAKAGIMFRQSTDPGSPYYAIFVTPLHGTRIQYRTVQDGVTQAITVSTASVPQWLKITRNGTNFVASTSSDGTTWNLLSTTAKNMTNLTGSLKYGLAATSHNTLDVSTVTYDNVSFNEVSGCPADWTCGDIGNPAVKGSISVQNNTYALQGGGNDIWDTTDQFYYASQALTGDGDITVRITAQSNTSSWAKSGIMMKESTTAGAKYVGVMVTPGNGIHMQYNFTGDKSLGTYTFPVWLRLTRAGNVFTAYTSTDGQTWEKGGSTTVAMNAIITMGLFTTSHNGGQLGTALFDNLKTNSTGTTTQLPAPWISTDIGNPQTAGTSTYNTGTETFAVTGAGQDIWGTKDQFQYVYQPKSTDTTIIARITSQTNTSSWAKAGLMIKQSAAANAPYIALMVTPGNGIHLQYNFNGDKTILTSYSFPIWLKLTKIGDIFTAYTSSDGISWTKGPSVTYQMAAPFTVGLFSHSHVWDKLSTTVFDNVSLQ